jgi:hypothetical protein
LIMAWIPLEEKTPPEYESVLLLEPFGEQICGDKHFAHFTGEFWETENGVRLNSYFSHWLEIPCTCHIVDELNSKLWKKSK